MGGQCGTPWTDIPQNQCHVKEGSLLNNPPATLHATGSYQECLQEKIKIFKIQADLGERKPSFRKNGPNAFRVLKGPTQYFESAPETLVNTPVLTLA